MHCVGKNTGRSQGVLWFLPTSPVVCLSHPHRSRNSRPQRTYVSSVAVLKDRKAEKIVIRDMEFGVRKN
jgi:hypothetical protein